MKVNSLQGHRVAKDSRYNGHSRETNPLRNRHKRCVPSIGCGCYVCTSDNPKNNRTRCSVVMGLEQGNLLVDTGPDLRHQLLREKIGLIHAVLYTHEHADHIFGMDDLRLFQFYLGHSVPIFCEARVEQRLRQSFDYAFTKREQTHRGSIPQLSMNEITTEPFQVLDTEVVPFHLPQIQHCRLRMQFLHQ